MDERKSDLRQEALFSVIVRKIVGPAFLVGGVVLSAYGVFRLATTGTVLVENQPTDDWLYIAVTILLPVVIAILGILLSRADPHYFDQ